MCATNAEIILIVQYPPLAGLDVTAENVTVPVVFECTRQDMRFALVVVVAFNVTVNADGSVFAASDTFFGDVGLEKVGELDLTPTGVLESEFTLDAQITPTVCLASGGDDAFSLRMAISGLEVRGLGQNTFIWVPTPEVRAVGGVRVYIVDYEYAARPMVSPSGIVRFSDQPNASQVSLPFLPVPVAPIASPVVTVQQQSVSDCKIWIACFWWIIVLGTTVVLLVFMLVWMFVIAPLKYKEQVRCLCSSLTNEHLSSLYSWMDV